MQVILVQAPAKNLKFNIGGYFKIIPLGIAYLARALKESSIDFQLYFPPASNNFYEGFEKLLESKKSTPLIVGISATLFAAREAFRLANIAKRINPKNIVVVGGAITSFQSEALFRYSGDLDYIIRGDGENIFPRLVLEIENGANILSIPNLSYKQDSKVISAKTDDYVDLNAIGFPLRENFPRWAHVLHPPMGRYAPAYLVETMRGCSYKCSFCSLPKKLRMRSIKKVIEELQDLSGRFKAQEVYFVDPTFTIDKKRTYELCKEMLDAKIKLPWTCMTRVDCIDKDLAQIMRASGCYLIHFGVESATVKILQQLNKEQSIADTLSAFNICKKTGIRTGAFMILAATPFDTEETFSNAVKLIKQIQPTYVLYDHIKPIPGQIQKESTGKQVINDYDLEEFYLGDKNKSRLCETTISGISKRTAEDWVRRGSRDFYLSPLNTGRILLGVRTKNDFINLLKAGLYYFKEMHSKSEW